ncbi:unnamed protein product, partial [Polarella glacialis]
SINLHPPSREGLLREYGGTAPAAKALREGWVQLTSSRHPRSRWNVFARLTADAVVCYKEPLGLL